MTDKDGRCLLTAVLSDSLQVSCLGYMAMQLKAGDIVESGHIYMQPVTYLLNEIRVKPKPKIMDLLLKCKLILANKDNEKSFEQAGFFKERVYERDDIVGYFDGFVKIYNGGFSEKYGDDALQFLNSDLIAITDFRRSQYPGYYEINEKYKNYSWVNIPNILLTVFEKKKYLHRKLFGKGFFEFFNFEYEDTILSDDGTQSIYVIRFILKDEFREKAISGFIKKKNNYLFSGKVSINSETFELSSFNIDQTSYQDLIWEYRPKSWISNLTVNYFQSGNKYLLNNVLLTSSYKKDDLRFNVVDEFNIETEQAKELSEIEIKSVYGSTSILKGMRIQRKSLPPNAYHPEKWSNYDYLLSPEITNALQQKYNTPLKDQFSEQTAIYSNLK